MQDELPQGDVHLIGKKRCTKAMASLIQDVFGKSDGVFQAQAALHGGGFRCSHGDVVRAKHAQDNIVGMIHFHVEVDGLPLTCMSPWSHVADHMYRVKHESFLHQHGMRSFGLHLVSQGRRCHCAVGVKCKNLHASPRPCIRTRAVLHVCVHIKPSLAGAVDVGNHQMLGNAGFGS